MVLIGLTGVALNPAMVAQVMAAAMPGPLVNTLHTWVITAGLALGAWALGRVARPSTPVRVCKRPYGAAGLLPSLLQWLAVSSPQTSHG